MIKLENFVVRRGDFLLEIPFLALNGGRNFLIGKNGSGKTTLLHSLAGLLASSGHFEVNGESKTGLPPEERRIGLIPQDLLLFNRMTVDDNLKSSVKYGKGDIAIYQELVDRMDLTPLLSKKSNEISLGQAQRVAIARAIISRPEVLLMDEPFSFQDEIARLGMISLIDEFAKKYRFEYIYATHNSRDLETGFSNLVSIDNGHIIENVDSLEKVEHYRTFSLLDYKNLASIGGRYYLLNEESLEFSNTEGLDYEIIGSNSSRYIRFRMDGDYFFATVKTNTSGRYVKVNTNKAREVTY